MNDVAYIADRQALDTMCQQLEKRAWLAVDTEFIREKTYFPQLALVQIADSDRVYCIDPVTIDDLSSLYELLENTGITKVFHAAGQDLEIFHHQRQCVPGPVFDTQIAASLLGLGEQIGYASLVKQLLRFELDKSHARTDWMQRPLQAEQIRYAADDVRYLGQLYPLLRQKLERLGRLDWMDDELERLQNPATYQPDPPTAWQRVKGSGKLRKKQLNILKHLAAWRERRAVQSDRPRRWILSDEVLINLALQHPADSEELRRIRMLDGKTAERYANDLLHLISLAQNESREKWPEISHSRKPSVQEEATVDLLMSVVRLCADKHQLSPGQITSRSELLKLLRGERNLPLLKGWRRQIAGREILDTHQGKLQVVCESGQTSLKPR